MGKFFFKPHEREGCIVKITDYTAHHMHNVLRFRVGQEIMLCDGECVDYHAKLTEVFEKPLALIFSLLSSTASKSEPIVPLALYQGIPKGDKIEWIIEKCIEAGASNIVPVFTSRTIAKVGSLAKKTERFARIAESAAAQSMRGIVPHVSLSQSFDEALAGCPSSDLLLVAYEKEDVHTIKSAIINIQPRPVSLWVGPEGGFADHEIQALVAKGALPVSLGSRILRTETAGIVALTQILCTWE